MPASLLLSLYCLLWFACRVQRSCSLSQWQPDAFRSPAELVHSKGYPVEEHVTVTEDGYVLSLQRVPRGARQLPGAFSGPPVLLVHGLLSSAAVWVINYPHQSLGFLLADAGYDVWLGNYRGTPYSRGHLEFSDKDSRYWEFGLDEVGLLDLPALVDYVLDHTGWPQLFLVGFSQGSAAAWAMLADKPEYNDKILLLSALAPVANMTFIRSPARFLVPISPILTASAIAANQGRLLVRPQWLRRATYALCESPLRYVCALPTFFLFGVNLNQLNQSRLAVYTSQLPAGASKRNVEQFAQIIRARNFVKYNYGPLRNLYRYGTVDSPAYDLSKITAPVALFSAHNDFFANPEDVSTLRQSLPNVVLDYIVPDLDFTHLDFILGINKKKGTGCGKVTWPFYWEINKLLQALPMNDTSLLQETVCSDSGTVEQAELVRSKGYPAEEHVTVTEDGYVLSLQRVPRGGRQLPGTFTGPPVLLVHGLLSSAAEWVINYPHQSLGFLLADAGYDVWLGNCRGTPYSRGHREYSDSDGRYWDFRLDEVGLLDLPALVDYVLARTGWPQLFLVGFSQGNTAAWAMLADKPQYNDKILLLVALAPVANMTFIRSPVRLLVPVSPILTASAIVANRGRLLVRPEWLRRAAYALCESPLRYACALPIFFLFGVNLNQLNQSRLAVYTSHLPSGASKRNVEQYAQIIRARNFVKYNYGPLRNFDLYGTAESPAYDFSKITAPVALFSARKDYFANPEDVSTLRRSLPNVVLDYIVPDPDFTHLDFVLGSETAAFVYRPLIDFMNNWMLLNVT